jgi:hypothetical protein
LYNFHPICIYFETATVTKNISCSVGSFLDNYSFARV